MLSLPRHIEQNLCTIQSTLPLKNENVLLLLTPTIRLVNLSLRARMKVYHSL